MAGGDSSGAMPGPDWRPGVRVVVRYRLPDGRATDAVGELLASDAREITVRTSRGPVVVRVADVVAGRVVPPRATRRGPPHLALSTRDLEDVMADGWRAVETGRLGGWLLRASEGFTGRGNSALPLDDPGMPLVDALDAVRRWYADRGLRASVALPRPPALPATVAHSIPPRDHGIPPPSALHAELLRQGWSERTPSVVMVAAARAVPRPATDLRVVLTDEPDDAWLALYRYRGQPLPPVAHQLLVSAPQQAFATVVADDAVVAVGRLALSRGWGGITAMQVADSHRRRGLGRVVLASLAAESSRSGASSVYLQVAAENTVARALYASSGFTEHHRYGYWSPAE